MKEEARKEQKDPTNPLTSSALTTHEDSPPWFLEEKDVACMRSLQDLYKKIERFDSLTLFYLLGNCESVNFQEVVQDEKLRQVMDKEIKAIMKNDAWKLAILPKGHKAISVKWLYKMKKNRKGEIEKYKTRCWLLENAYL